MEKSNANMVKLRVMEVADAGVRSGSASTAMLVAERERDDDSVQIRSQGSDRFKFVNQYEHRAGLSYRYTPCRDVDVASKARGLQVQQKTIINYTRKEFSRAS